ERIEKEKEVKKKYEAMRKKVLSWEPPSFEHIALKDFMLQQIDVCLEDSSSNYYENELRSLTLKSGEKWRKGEKEKLLNDLSYHIKEHQAELERCASRTKWIRELRKSLKDE
ncbi:MAG TPA: hypothetical protein V6D12_13990, partial [Candidatus Obscuribacterales bacterium]